MKSLTIILLLLTTKCYSQSNYESDDRKKTGLVLTIGGVAFTTAAILEGSANYSTNQVTKGTNGNSPIHRLTNPSFIEQTPRNIMFTVGLTLTITGLITLGNK